MSDAEIIKYNKLIQDYKNTKEELDKIEKEK
jgi:hypothetical protein